MDSSLNSLPTCRYILPPSCSSFFTGAYRWCTGESNSMQDTSIQRSTDLFPFKFFFPPLKGKEWSASHFSKISMCEPDSIILPLINRIYCVSCFRSHDKRDNWTLFHIVTQTAKIIPFKTLKRICLTSLKYTFTIMKFKVYTFLQWWRYFEKSINYHFKFVFVSQFILTRILKYISKLNLTCNGIENSHVKHSIILCLPTLLCRMYKTQCSIM